MSGSFTLSFRGQLAKTSLTKLHSSMSDADDQEAIRTHMEVGVIRALGS